MTLLDDRPEETYRERCIPVLETERLVLRAPRLEDAVRAVIDHAFEDLDYDALGAGARVTNPASRRVLEKCGFQWTGVGLTRIRALASSAPIDRFRLERSIWRSLKSWGAVKRVA